MLWVLGSLCQIYRIPFDAKLVLQRFAPPYTLATLCEAGESLGLAVGEWREVRTFAEVVLPCVALVKAPGGHRAANDEDTPAPLVPALLLKSDGTRFLYFRAGSESGETAPVADFPLLFQPAMLSVGRAPQAANEAGAEEDKVEAQPRGFGFSWFVPELLRHKSVWRDVLLASLAIQLMALATPLFTQAIIDKVIVHQTHSTLKVVAFALGMFMLFSAAMTWVRQYLVIHTGNRIDAVLGTHVFSYMLRLPLRYFEQRPTGVVVSRLHGVETIRDFLSGAAVSLVLDLPFLFIFVAVMFMYSWQLTLVALTALTIISLLSLAATPVFRKRLNDQFLLGARNQAFVTEYVSGMATVKSMQMEPTLERRYGDYLASYLKAGFRARQLSNTINTLASAVEQGMTLSILVVGALLVMTNPGFTIGMLVAFQMFASRMSQPMLRLVGLWQEFQQASVAVKRLGDMMNIPTEPYATVPARSHRNAGRIDVISLGFRYSEQHPLIYRDFSMILRPGQLTALMGPSGSGKSTLTKLLLGFYAQTDGQILLDGRDLRNLSANELRQAFGVVPQETLLFSGTIYENLIMANPHAAFQDVIEACRKAEIHEVIEGLPQGYQTVIGEHGVGLSGGQRQRVAIARALLKRPSVLIFDEATSNLDVETSEHFARTVNQLKGSTTVLYIAHQLPRGLAVDAIVRLSDPSRPAVASDSAAPLRPLPPQMRTPAASAGDQQAL
ncbi:MAG TPA: peptidase domain-containing ABC transporter [Burkholderiales bacterium]|nr:peptidase domain-containing ABC transporter [Burkholderiales bacterium]